MINLVVELMVHYIRNKNEIKLATVSILKLYYTGKWIVFILIYLGCRELLIESTLDDICDCGKLDVIDIPSSGCITVLVVYV